MRMTCVFVATGVFTEAFWANRRIPKSPSPNVTRVAGNGGRNMTYPTEKQVSTATHLELCRWYRFLASPGMSAIGTVDYDDTLRHETRILNLIVERVKEFGGFTASISKMIGWEP
jgi:hypothetical protein